MGLSGEQNIFLKARNHEDTKNSNLPSWMDDYRSRPVPKQRPNKTMDGRSNIGFGSSFGDKRFIQQVHVSTANMYDNSLEDNLSSQPRRGSFADTSELPSCVKHRNQVVTEEQKGKDSQLPKLLNDLDEVCKHGVNEDEKVRLAYLILHAASSPIRKYRLLQFFSLLDSNKSETSVVKVPDALVILEKYATNLLKDEKHRQWRIVKFNLSIIQNQVFPVQGAAEVLMQMGYTEITEKAFAFPENVLQPQKQTAVVLASDLIIARIEMNMLLTNEHPFLIFHASPSLSGMGQNSPAEKMGRGTDSVSLSNTERGHCGVCSEQNVTMLCKECKMQFCKECDERWHSHKQRLSHDRFDLLNPVHKEKSEKDNTDVRRRPVPVPRQRKVQKPDNELAAASRQQPITIQPSSPYPNLSSHTSPLNQQIRHPPLRSSPGRSPGNALPLNANHYSRVSEPQSKFPFSPAFSNGNPTLAQTQMGAQGDVVTPQRWQMQTRPTQPQTISPPFAAVGNEALFGCPNCNGLVSSTETLCPHCKHQLVKNVPKNTNMSPYGMPTTAPFQGSGGNNPLKSSQDFDHQFRGRYIDLPSSQKDQSLARRKLPERPDEKRSSTSFTHSPTNNSSLYEEVIPMEKRGDHFKDGWDCEHCTFHNPITTQVCILCCKTPSDLKNHPSVTGKAPSNGSSNLADQLTSPVEGKIQGNIDPEVAPMGLYSTLKGPPSEALYMTPKNLPLEGGIYVVPKDQPPPLPAKHPASGRTQPGGHVLNAQKSREQELSEKEKGKKLSKQKLHLLQSGQITEDEYYNPVLLEERGFDMARLNEPQPNRSSEEQMKQQLLQAGVITQDDIDNNDRMWNRVAERPSKPELRSENELKLSDEELFRLLGNDVFLQEGAPRDNLPYGNVQIEKPKETGSKLTYNELLKLYEAGLIPQETLNNSLPASQAFDNQLYQVPKMAQHPDPKQISQAEIQGMFEEFYRIDTNPRERKANEAGVGFNKTGFPDMQNFHVTRNVHLAPINLYDKMFLKNADMPAPPSKSNSDFLSLPSHLGSHSFIEGQSRVYVEWMKKAESHGFTPEELNLATNLSWQDPKGRDPVEWLKEEWTARLVEVIGKVAELTKSKNDRIGNLSTEEAKKALVESDGNVQSACKACIESRREKLAKMSEIAGFGQGDCLNALDSNNGDLDKAILELEKKALEPIRKRILGNEDGGGQDIKRDEGEMNSKFVELVTNNSITFERRVRVLFAEKHGKSLVSWGRAETVVKLIDMKFSVEDSLEAAAAYGDMERSLRYLKQECPVCLDLKPMSQMITFLMCQDRICKGCVTEHLTLQIKEKNIHNLVCPVCGLPDLSDVAEATEYFNNLDIMIRQIVDKDVHDLFQQKLRDFTLRKEPNFRWCAHCSCGFINEQPQMNKMMCPNCEQFTCFSCKKKWEVQHQGISCEQFARWQEENDDAFQIEGLAGHLARHGIDCPQCQFRYDLAKGGCMHFKCIQCTHEFCSGCSNPFKHGAKCTVSESCARKGIHAHHPRDCLFYLRDWTPKRLQDLLDKFGVDYNIEPAAVAVQGEEENGEVAGAVGGAIARCKVMEQKDGPEGLVDKACGSPCEAGHFGLCKVHFTEYLVSLIKRNDIDPAYLMDADEMTIVLRRVEMEPVAREVGEDENLYRERIFNILRERLPLRGQDVEQQEDQPEEPQPILV